MAEQRSGERDSDICSSRTCCAGQVLPVKCWSYNGAVGRLSSHGITSGKKKNVCCSGTEFNGAWLLVLCRLHARLYHAHCCTDRAVGCSDHMAC